MIVVDAVANCIILEERDVMASYVHAFDTLRSAALTWTESMAFIEKVANSVAAGNEGS
ncbi:hypothetical protein GTW37_10060 [Streptomyces sp. SID4931]|nr:hypothetical protein [Streptomyces sp. SID4931]SCF78165.1 hypothetical protein GA0115255_106164 [Streptomyces sp. Ncost-T6T-2b]